MGGGLRKHKSRSGQNEIGKEKARKNVNEWVSSVGSRVQLAPLRNYGTSFDGQNNTTTLHAPALPQNVYVPISGTCDHVMLQSKEEFRLYVQLSLVIISKRLS